MSSSSSTPLAEYLSALEARDQREQAHAYYINAYTKLADRPAAEAAQAQTTPSTSASTKSIRPGTSTSKTLNPKGRASSVDVTSSPAGGDLQMRADLAATHKVREELETKLTAATTELAALRITDAEQKKKIAMLEKAKEVLERRVKDRADELQGKTSAFTGVQDELMTLEMQITLLEKEVERLKGENAILTQQVLNHKAVDIKAMNAENDQKFWEKRRKG